MTHDPLCPNHASPHLYRAAGCTYCRLIRAARADEREECGREAQAAIARLDIRSDTRYSVNDLMFHQAWRDGWQTGYDAATSRIQLATASPLTPPNHKETP